MPKARNSRSTSFEGMSPYPVRGPSSDGRPRASSSAPGSSGNPAESFESPKDFKEWDEVRCPVCMEHPHNAVLLLCSSHDKGCRPFMCDTSYRHSNCLDQYRKTFSTLKSVQENLSSGQQPTQLSCPLCRGQVSDWIVVEAARRYMNTKSRNCSMESCGFNGVYEELRKHARKEHPSVRPSEVNPEQQQDWRRMERQRDLGDLFSMIRSSVTREEDRVEFGEVVEEPSGSALTVSSVVVLLVVQVRRGEDSGAGRSSQPESHPQSSLTWGSSRRDERRRRRRPTLWGGSLNSASFPSRANSEEANNDDHNHVESEED